ncbi:MAG: hypothetical protein Q9195_007565 [Heterodermia aff. obscurata]
MSGSVPSAAEAAKNELVRDVEVDAEVIKYLPEGSKLISAQSHGASFWTRTAKITVELVNGSIQTFFLKLAEEDIGRRILKGEFEGVKAIYAAVPALVPRPIACGAYTSTPSTYFYLAEFVSMIEEVPEPQAFCAMLAKLHQDSISLSPNGKFGFHVTTYAENKVQGPSEELDQLLPTLFDRVIPRLLRPLSTEGRTIPPVLVHGDLWYGNMATNADTGGPISFDPAAWWAHNEYELATFNVPRYKIGRKYMEEYHKHFPVSAPEEDYEDRNRLYSL